MSRTKEPSPCLLIIVVVCICLMSITIYCHRQKNTVSNTEKFVAYTQADILSSQYARFLPDLLESSFNLDGSTGVYEEKTFKAILRNMKSAITLIVNEKKNIELKDYHIVTLSDDSLCDLSEIKKPIISEEDFNNAVSVFLTPSIAEDGLYYLNFSVLTENYVVNYIVCTETKLDCEYIINGIIQTYC